MSRGVIHQADGGVITHEGEEVNGHYRNHPPGGNVEDVKMFGSSESSSSSRQLALCLQSYYEKQRVSCTLHTEEIKM